jgi:hypothetical protein
MNDLIKVPLYDFSYPSAEIDIYNYSQKDFYKLDILILKIPILYFSGYEFHI